MMKKKPLIVLTGPTAVGKTALSIDLAKQLNGEIISADSMQVYQKMDIGSAKITPEEMQGVPHHLINILSPEESFDVYRFQTMAKKAMEEIYQNNHLPIVVGGTGFYIQALVYNIDFTKEEADIAYRKRLEQMAKSEEKEKLYTLLRETDPQSALAIHPNNTKRIIRALEYYHLTGEPISKHNSEMRKKTSPYAFCYFVLNDDRQKIYQSIDERVDRMIQNGLIEEVRNLKESGLTLDHISMQGLGYKEIYAYLMGKLSLAEAIYIIKRDTRHFAKRQLTWFRREKDVCWVQKDSYANDNEIKNFMMKYIHEKLGSDI